MRILLTNDDGINAPGLEILERLARQISDDVWTIAPETDQSGIGHAMSLSQPLRLRKLREKTFALNGTPTDCVIMAVREVLPQPPDLVLSGINAGPNVGDHVLYSGTVAGAMEGSFLGIRSIALSQSFNSAEDRTLRWETVEALAPAILTKLIAMNISPTVLVNINFPNCEPDKCRGNAIVSQGKLEHSLDIERRLDGRGIPYHWLTFINNPPEIVEGTDIWALRNDMVAISPLKTDLTETRLLSQFNQHFED